MVAQLIGSCCGCVKETVFDTFLFFYYWLEAVLFAITPGGLKRKNVKGEKVLVTGSGIVPFMNQGMLLLEQWSRA